MTTFNHALADEIIGIITANPEQHDQNVWINECGTTRCIAGWAVTLTSNDLVYSEAECACGCEIAYCTGWHHENSNSDVDFMAEGMDALGLTLDQARKLFLSVNNEDAVSILKDIANGEA